MDGLNVGVRKFGPTNEDGMCLFGPKGAADLTGKSGLGEGLVHHST